MKSLEWLNVFTVKQKIVGVFNWTWIKTSWAFIKEPNLT